MRLLNKLLNIRPTEWPRLLLLYLMLFLLVTGMVWGEIILEATFLTEVGLNDLPWFFIVRASISIPAVAIYTIFADQVANTKLLIIILLITSLVIVVGLVFLGLGLTTAAYWLLFLLIFALDDVISVHWFTYVNDFYDTQSAKRIIPILITAIGVANIAAGLTVPILNKFPFVIIILMWLGTVLIIASLAWLMPYLLKESKSAGLQPVYNPNKTASAPSKTTVSYLDSLREGFHYVIGSTYLRWLVISTLVLMALFTLLKYQIGAMLLDEFETEVGISNFTSQLTWITNVAMLLVQLFLLNRLIGQIGVGNAELIFPMWTLAVCTGLIFTPANKATIGLTYVTYSKLYASFGYPIESLLFNAVPLRMKARARAFISGLLVPIGVGIAGFILLALQFSQSIWLLSTLIITLAVAYVASAWVIRRQYSKALIAMLEQEDFSFLLAPNALNLTITDPATLTVLRKKLDESTSYEFTVFIAKLISQIGGKEATQILSQAARNAADARSRAAILDVLVAADTQGETVRQLYTDFLADPNTRVRQSAISGLEQLSGSQDKEFLELALNLLTDSDIEIRARVLPPLLQTNNPALKEPALQVLNEFLNNPDPHLCARGVHILYQTGEPDFISQLFPYLSHSADEVRLETALAVEALTLKKLPPSAIQPILAKMAELANDPIQRVRQTALIILGRLGGSEIYHILINALTDPTPQIRMVAADTLVQIGKAVIPKVQQALNSPNIQLRKMASVVLSRINRKEFGSIIETHIKDNLAAIYQDHSRLLALAPCNEYPGIALMQNTLREQNQHRLEENFYLLTAIHDPGEIKVISDSLQSEAAYIRANAIEALETLTTPHTAGLIAPLFEPDFPSSKLVEIGQETWNIPQPNTTSVIEQIIKQANDPWLRVMMIFSLGEIASYKGVPPANKTTPAKKPDSPKDSRRHPRPTDLLKALDDTGETNQPAQQPQEEPRLRRARTTGLLDVLTEGNNEPKPAEAKPEEVKPEGSKTRRPRSSHLFGALKDTLENVSAQLEEKPNSVEELPASASLPFSLPEIKYMINMAFTDPSIDVRLAARTASLMMSGTYMKALMEEEGALLSPIEKIIFLKEVPFFQGMTVDQLKVLASVCEEQLFEEDKHIFDQGDPGGALYVVISGRVGIEQEKRKGSFARLATIEAHSYFGEMDLFDNNPRSATAIALQDTLILRLRREPLIALARQYPDLSLELISVLSQRLRESNDRVADLTRTRTRELQKFFDKFD
jgi:HEAT repeat protein